MFAVICACCYVQGVSLMRYLLVYAAVLFIAGCAAEAKHFGVPERVWDILTEEQKAQVEQEYRMGMQKKIQEIRDTQPQAREEKIIYPHKVENRKPMFSKTFKWGQGSSENKK